MPNELPTDGAEVWVRLHEWSGEPFMAKWEYATQSFTTLADGLVFPWYIVSRWRNL